MNPWNIPYKRLNLGKNTTKQQIYNFILTANCFSAITILFYTTLKFLLNLINKYNIFYILLKYHKNRVYEFFVKSFELWIKLKKLSRSLIVYHHILLRIILSNAVIYWYFLIKSNIEIKIIKKILSIPIVHLNTCKITSWGFFVLIFCTSNRSFYCYFCYYI